MTSEAPPTSSRHVVTASCFVLGLAALLVWRLGVWQSTATAAPADQQALPEVSRGGVVRSPVEPASWSPPAAVSRLEALETQESHGTVAQLDLDALTVSDPDRALGLAREALASDPDGPLAPRHARALVKALASLGRFHEARDEARRIVERYRGTPEALDVERHLLVYPFDQPSRERMQAEASRSLRH